MAGVRMVFQGKYRFAAWDKSRIIMKTDGSLDVLAEKGGGVPVSESGMDDRFNLYGMHKNETVIQAMNGNYISWTPRFGYQADQEEQETAEILRIIKKTEELWFFYREDKERNRYYMNVEDGHLSEISIGQEEGLPDTACFHVETITGSLSQLVLCGARGADLEWADLRYAVLRNVDMTECSMIKTTLACADVCGTMFDRALMNVGIWTAEAPASYRLPLYSVMLQTLTRLGGHLPRQCSGGAVWTGPACGGLFCREWIFRTPPVWKQTLRNRPWMAPLCLKGLR